MFKVNLYLQVKLRTNVQKEKKDWIAPQETTSRTREGDFSKSIIVIETWVKRSIRTATPARDLTSDIDIYI